MRAKDQIIVGLEVGTSKVCAVVGEVVERGNIMIIGVGQAASEGVRKGEIIDIDAAVETIHKAGDDVPAWFLDTAWNGLSFHVSQAFFPRTSAWDNLRRSLKGEFDDSVWDHLSGTVSAPFSQDGTCEVAVKVIDDRGNELLVVRSLDEAE